MVNSDQIRKTVGRLYVQKKMRVSDETRIKRRYIQFAAYFFVM